MTKRILAATLVALVATAGVAEAKPSRLWYRAALTFDETRTRDTAFEFHEITSRWALRSTGASIVSIVCVGRRTLILLANKPCAKAYRRVRWQRFARNDLAFGATVRGVWELYAITTVKKAPLDPVPESGGFVKCDGETLVDTVTKAPYIGGILASDSLVRAGVGLSFEIRSQTDGEMSHRRSGYKCTHTDYDGAFLREDVFASSQEWTAFTTTPTPHTEDFMRMRVGSVGQLGKAISIQRSFTTPFDDHVRETTISLSLSPCPRGGRAVRRC